MLGWYWQLIGPTYVSQAESALSVRHQLMDVRAGLNESPAYTLWKLVVAFR